MLYLLLTVMSFHELHASTKEITEARQSITSLISPLLPGPKKAISALTKDFRVDKCQTEKVNWMDVLTMRKKVTLVFKFKEGCDIEGTVSPRVFGPFPAEFKLRNLKLYDRVRSMNTVSSTFESQPVMTIQLREGVLYGRPGKLKFEADYQVQIDPLKPDKPVHKNLGGEIRINEISGKKVSIKEKILIE